VIRNQGLRLDHSLLLEFPNQAAVRIILEAKQADGQVVRRPRAIAASVVKIKPPLLMQGLKRLLPGFMGQLVDHVAERLDAGNHFEQSSEAVMTIHHPEMSKLIAHQRDWLAIEIATTLLGTFLTEIALPIPYLSHPHTHLCGLKVSNGHLEEFEPFGVVRYRGVFRKMQRADLNAACIPLCRG
jgi:hypothetical protein